MQDLARCQEDQLTMCAALERLADSLPGCADKAALGAVAGAVVPLMRRASAQWIEAGLPALPAWASTALPSEFSRQDEEDLALAEEIDATLREWAERKASLCAEALGYLIRGFVIARRRRVALERWLAECGLRQQAR